MYYIYIYSSQNSKRCTFLNLMGWENVSWAGPSYGRLWNPSRDMEVTSNPSCFEPHKQIYHVGCFKMVNRNIGVRDVFDCFCTRDIISLSLFLSVCLCVGMLELRWATDATNFALVFSRRCLQTCQSDDVETGKWLGEKQVWETSRGW